MGPYPGNTGVCLAANLSVPPAKAAEDPDEADWQPEDMADPMMAQGIPGPR